MIELSYEEIEQIAGNNDVFQAGYELFQQHLVVSLDIDERTLSNEILINASIKENKHYYEVNISIEKDDQNIQAHICSCEKNHSFEVCPHIIATLFELSHRYVAKETSNLPEVSTIDEDMKALIDAYAHDNIYSTLALSSETMMELEPVFEIRHNVFAFTLKIGHEKKYMVRDLQKLLIDIKECNYVRYGKDLSFTHHLNTFDSRSKIILSFLAAHIHDNNFYGGNQRSDTRLLMLSPGAFDQFFQMYVDQEVMYRYEAQRLTNVKFIDHNPNMKLNVFMDNLGNYQISLNHHFYTVLNGVDHIFILLDRVLYRCDYAYGKACEKLLFAYSQRNNPFSLPKQQMSSFYNNILLSIQDFIELEGVDISEFAPSPLTCKLYLDMPTVNVITARLVYNYGLEEYNLHDDNQNPSRNFKEEVMVRLLLMQYMNRDYTEKGYAAIENSQDLIFEFVQHGLHELSKFCEVYASDVFKRVQIKARVNISMGVRIKSDLLEIDIDSFDFPSAELENVLKAYRLNKKYYRMKNGSFVNIEDSALKELSSIMNGLRVSDQMFNEGKITVPKYRTLFLDNQMNESHMLKIERDHAFKDVIKNIHNIKDSDYEVPPFQKPILRNYQKTGFRWLKTMTHYGFGAILADDMGIGKTIQMITVLADAKQNNEKMKALIICPSSLLLNWLAEIEKFSDNLSAQLISGHNAERMKAIKNIVNCDISITSYDYLKRDIEAYDDIVFDYQIIDEAQYIKNHVTKNASSVKQIQSTHRFALTGTPIENSLAELWSIFDFLMPGYLYNYNFFKKEYEIPIVKEQNQPCLNALKRLVEPFILRRIKKDVLKELPEKTERTLFVDLYDETRKLYHANVTSIKQDIRSISKQQLSSNRIMILTMLTRLRQLCLDPRLIYDNYTSGSAKVDACLELIRNSMAASKKILIFSQFTSLLTILENELKKEEIPYYLLKGSTPKIQRQQLVNSFNTNKIPVFLISLKAGGTGLNLTGAEIVIHFDPWWNISMQNQATDRAYRIGQHNNVQVFHLIAKDTIEEKIMELQQQKQGLSDSIIQENSGVISQMSKEEILDLF